mgnify:CR=1 FL=1
MPTPRLSNAEIADALARDLPGWSHADGVIARAWRTAGWRAGLSLVAEIGDLAEAADHHPDVLLRFAEVVVRLSTHDAGGVTEKDLTLAREIETLFGRDLDGGDVSDGG